MSTPGGWSEEGQKMLEFLIFLVYIICNNIVHFSGVALCNKKGVSLLIFQFIQHYTWLYIHLFITFTTKCFSSLIAVLQLYKREELS